MPRDGQVLTAHGGADWVGGAAGCGGGSRGARVGRERVLDKPLFSGKLSLPAASEMRGGREIMHAVAPLQAL